MVWGKVTSKGDYRIIVPSANDFSGATEQSINEQKQFTFLQEEISSRISEVIDWSLINSQSLGLFKNNIHIFTCNDGYAVQTF